MSRGMLLMVAVAACQPGGKGGPGGATGGDGADGGGAGSGGGTGDDTAIVVQSGCSADDAVHLGGDVCVDAAPCAWTGAQGYGYFGYAVDAGRDFDGDGVPDVAIGAPVTDIPDGSGGVVADAGQVTLLSGARLGDDGGGVVATFDGRLASDQAGNVVQLTGDATGDGVADLLVGARGVAPSGELVHAGAVYLIAGQAGDGDAPVSLEPLARFTGERTLARTGTALAAPGDVDGDGLADLLMQGELRDETAEGDEIYAGGRAYLVLGTHAFAADNSLADADARLLAEGTRDAAGLALAGGDFDGDGYADVAVGAPYADGSKGRVYLLPGGPGAIAGDVSLSTAPVQLRGTGVYDAFGWTLAAGDVTGDGIDELAIGVPLHDDPFPAGGKVELYGGATGVFSGVPARLAVWTGDFDEHQLGTGVHLGADVDGDGTGDVMLGAVAAWKGLVTKGGKVVIVKGREGSWPTEPTPAAQADGRIHGSAVGDYLGRAVAGADLDGDGTAEVVLGTGYTENGGYSEVGTVYLFWGGAL